MQKPLILYSNQSRVCARLFPFVQKSNISFQQLCVDSDEAKRSCAKWGVQVVPAVIEFEDDNIFYHEGFDMCKNFILENSPIPQPQQSHRRLSRNKNRRLSRNKNRRLSRKNRRLSRNKDRRLSRKKVRRLSRNKNRRLSRNKVLNTTTSLRAYQRLKT